MVAKYMTRQYRIEARFREREPSMIFDLQSIGALELEEAGIFTWNVGADLVFGDSSVALLFDFPFEVSTTGQKMSAYLARIHPDDLPEVALHMHNAIASCGVFSVRYRVRGAANLYRLVASHGRCFRGTERDMTQFAGIIYPVEPTQPIQ